MIASTRPKYDSSISSTLRRFLMAESPGTRPISWLSGPIRRTRWYWARKSSSVRVPFFIRSESDSTSSSLSSSFAFSMRVRRSPMPRMREAKRSGWKASSASAFSPVPTNLMGTPVTARMERAAPPRASPSSFVRMRPVTLVAQVEGELGGGGGLAGALEAHHHHDGRRGLRVLQPALAAAQYLHELLVDDVDDLLHGGEAGEHLRSQGPLLHPLDELPDDLEVDVGLQEG